MRIFIFNITMSPNVWQMPMYTGFVVGDINGDIGDIFLWV